MPGAERRLLVLGDYPIGFANGIGETLSNLLDTWGDAEIFHAYPSHFSPGSRWASVTGCRFEVPRPPAGWPVWAARAYTPILKIRQAAAQRQLVRDAAAMIEQHRIQAVLTYPVTPWILFAALQLRRQFPGVRFGFYVMDDWEGHHTCFGLPFTPKRRAALASMVATADARFACSDVMRRDYEQRFANAWGVLHKGVALTAPLPPPPWRPFTDILYTGGMNIFRFDAVLAFAEGLHRFRQQSGRPVTLTLLGPEPDRAYAQALGPYPFIRTEPWVGNEECQSRMARADLLYLPLSFRPSLARIAELAMPTKFSEYLASGRPTIFQTPGGSEVQALADRAGLPLTINSADPQEVCDLLLQLDRDGLDLADYQSRAQRLVRDEFDQDVLRRRLARSLFPGEPSLARDCKGPDHDPTPVVPAHPANAAQMARQQQGQPS